MKYGILVWSKTFYSLIEQLKIEREYSIYFGEVIF
jgi:hypothetical protein